MYQTSSASSILLIEFGLALFTGAVSLLWPRGGAQFFRTVETIWNRLARRRAASVLAAGSFAGLLRLAILPFSPIPHPFLTDDPSYLLAAETFASGRLSNPGHPMWVHLEAFHLTVSPQYMSMYFPAQSLFMAAGWWIAGHPWWGVWVSCALMCAALCWMLQAWLPAGWALGGAALAALRLGLFSYWIDSYMGGAVAALGGALVLGALPRIQRRFRTRDFFWLALGVSLLANSRPYEGLLVCLPAVAALAWLLWKKPHPGFPVLVRRAAPGALVLAAAAAFLGYYNERVFGTPLTLPYAAARGMYASAPHFVFQKERPEPVYRHQVFRQFYSGWEREWYRSMQTPAGFALKSLKKVAIALLFYCGTALLIPLVMLPWALRDHRIRFLVVTGAVVTVGLSVETWLLPHYLAPFAAGIYAILLQCMRHLRAAGRRGGSSGLFLSRALPAVCLAIAVLRLAAQPLHLALPSPKSFTPFGIPPLGDVRAQVDDRLSRQPGPQLALVRYTPDHDAAMDWVYNHADIDASKVVWARDMSPDQNRELLAYYGNRRVWLVEPDFNPPRVTPYRPDHRKVDPTTLLSAVRAR